MVKHGIDAIMLLLLPPLMAELITGQELHEWLGTAMVVLFLAHHGLNLGWYKNLLKGRYGPSRFLWTALDLLLTVDMLTLAVSGVMMSGFVFRFLPIRGGMLLARRLHLLASHWGLLLMSLHLGLHWSVIMAMGRKITRNERKNAARTRVLQVAALMGAVYGVYAFIQQNFADYLFLKAAFVSFDEQKPAALHLLEYAAVIWLFTAAGHYLTRLAQRAKGAHSAWKWASVLCPLAVCVAAAALFSAGKSPAPDWAADSSAPPQQTQAVQTPAAAAPSLEPAPQIEDGLILISGVTYLPKHLELERGEIRKRGPNLGGQGVVRRSVLVQIPSDLVQVAADLSIFPGQPANGGKQLVVDRGHRDNGLDGCSCDGLPDKLGLVHPVGG